MDVLTGLTLDNTNLPTGTVASGAPEKGAVFEKVLGDEMQQLQLDDSTANVADVDQLLITAELDAETLSTNDLDSHSLGNDDKALNGVGVLLTGQQQVIKTDAIPVAVDTEYWLREADTTVRHTMETPTAALPVMATVQESSGQSDDEAGNSLPQRKTIGLGASQHKTMATVIGATSGETPPGTDKQETTMGGAKTDNTVATTIGAGDLEPLDKTNLDSRQSETGNARKNEAAVASALQQASTPTVVNFVPKNSGPSQSAAPTPVTSSMLNPVAASSSFNADMAVTARVGDVGKWVTKGDVSREASIADVGVSMTSAAQETRSSETSIPAGLRLPFFNPRFNDVVSNQVLWMSKQGINQADIHLNPAELGPITVRLQQNGQETSVQFVVAHPATKEQLEQALPRLRDVFQHGGLQLINVDIQDGRKQPQHDQSSAMSSAQRSTNSNHSAVAASLAAPLASQPEGLVDFYA